MCTIFRVRKKKLPNFNSYASLVHEQSFFVLRRKTTSNDLPVTSGNISRFLNPDIYGRTEEFVCCRDAMQLNGLISCGKMYPD
jgi:hypothetical protein